MKFAPYPAYKPSGIDWLGDVPEHWTCLPARRRFRIVNGATPASSEDLYWDGDITWITPEDLGKNESKTIRVSRRQISREGLNNCGATVVPKGSIIISTRAPIGHLAIATVEACTNQGCRCIIKLYGELCSEFYYYSLFASRSTLQAMGKGTTFLELSSGSLGGHVLPFPSPPEQRAIADFLDAETAKLDALVAKKRTLIERLKEKRSALISRTVTRGLPLDAAAEYGLDPNPPLEPSGIDWLGNVPEHWDVAALKRAVLFQRGHDLPSDNREEGDVPIVSSAGISGTHSEARAKGPGIVTGRYGTIGQFHLIKVDYWPLNTTLYSIDLRGNDPAFLRYMLAHLSPLFLLHAVKSAVPGVDRNDLHPTKTAVPPVSEQRAIADYLDRETAKIDQLVASVEDAIARLQEYRSAVITAAVTGKIDLRGAAA